MGNNFVKDVRYIFSKWGCTFSLRLTILHFWGVTGYISQIPSYNFLIFEELQVTYLYFQVTRYSFVMKSYDFFRPLGGIPVLLNGYFETSDNIAFD